MLRLCSQSTSRAAILTSTEIDFIQSPVDFDEDSIIAKDAKSFVYKATLGKYERALELFDYKTTPILVADSVVTSKGLILRKARCKEEARNILMSQSGVTTSIVTCMIYQSSAKKIVDISSTDYLFNPFDVDDLERYLDSGKWRGKAGGCMVEGFCKKYIKKVIGYESSAMGLNVEVLKAFI